MTDFIFKSRFGYRRHYIPKGHQKLRWVDLNDECDVTVSDVEPDAAPVTYKISLLDKSPESHEIRSYAGSLWLAGPRGFRSAESFGLSCPDRNQLGHRKRDP
jgi:hypothetical protein